MTSSNEISRTCTWRWKKLKNWQQTQQDGVNVVDEGRTMNQEFQPDMPFMRSSDKTDSPLKQTENTEWGSSGLFMALKYEENNHYNDSIILTAEHSKYARPLDWANSSPACVLITLRSSRSILLATSTPAQIFTHLAAIQVSVRFPILAGLQCKLWSHLT